MADNRKFLDQLIKFGVDKTSLDTLRRTMTRMADDFEVVDKKAKSAAESTVTVGKAAGDAAKQVAGLQAKMVAFADGADKAKNATDKLKRNIADITDIGQFGEAILRPMETSANNFVRYAGQASAESAEWLAIQKQIELSNLRMGKEFATALLPSMREAAKWANSLANWVSNNKGLVQGAVTIGGGLATIAGIGAASKTAVEGIGGLFTALNGAANLLAKIAPAGGAAVSVAKSVAPAISSAPEFIASRFLPKPNELPDWKALQGAYDVGGKSVTALGNSADGATKAVTGATSAIGGVGDVATKFTVGTGTMLLSIAGVVAGMVALNEVLANQGVQNVQVGTGVTTVLGALAGPLGMAALKLQDATGTQGQVGFAKANEYATVAAYGLGKAFSWLPGMEGAATDWAASIGGLTGAIDKQAAANYQAAQAAETATDSLAALKGIFLDNAQAQQAVGDYLDQSTAANTKAAADKLKLDADYIAAQNTAFTDYYADAAKMNSDFQAKQKQESAQWDKRRLKELIDFYKGENKLRNNLLKEQTKAAQDFAKGEAKQEESYYKNRAKAAEDYNEDIADAEADHLEQMRKLAEGHDDRLSELVAQRDALGIVREMRSYEKQRKEAETDYQKGVAEKDKQRAEDLAEQEANFAEQRAERLKDFEERQAEQREQFEEQRKEREADFAERRAEAQAEENDRRKVAYNAHIRDLSARAAQYKAELDKLRQSNLDKLTALDANIKAEQTRLKAAFDSKMLQLKTEAGLLSQEEQRLINEKNARNLSSLQSYLDGMGVAIKSLPSYAQMTGLDPNAAARAKIQSELTTAQASRASLSSATPSAAVTAQIAKLDEQIKTLLAQLAGLSAGKALTKPKADGGYADLGLYALGGGGREFVMNSAATLAAENIMGARLSQDRVISALVNGGGRGGYSGGGGNNISLSLDLTFNNSKTGPEIADTVRREVVSVLTESFRTLNTRRSPLPIAR